MTDLQINNLLCVVMVAWFGSLGVPSLFFARRIHRKMLKSIEENPRRARTYVLLPMMKDTNFPIFMRIVGAVFVVGAMVALLGLVSNLTGHGDFPQR